MVTTVFRQPVMTEPIQDVDDLIDHLKPLLERHLAGQVSRIYFGDVGIYLPTDFQGPRKQNLPILVLQPAFDRLIEGTRVASQESRLIGVDVVGLINITPYFTARPEEALGERQLSELMKKIRVFLTQQSNSNLDGRVQFFSVGDVNWNWLQRKNLSLRGASLEVSARVKVNRMRQQ